MSSSSLYAYNFTLLPRPPRSLLSIGSDATRATLPDFSNVAQLRQFVQRLHVWRFDVPGTFIQFKFGAVYVSLLLAVVIAIILRRMYDRTFWLVRFIDKPTGRVIVPNAMLVFSVIEGVYAMAIIAFLWLYSRWFELSSRDKHVPVNPLLWIALPCCPLITGAMWAAWGTHFATPLSAQLDFGMRQRPTLQKFFGHAVTINALFVLCPLAVIVTVLVPGILSNDGYNKGLRMGQAWQAQYGMQVDFTEAMVQDAQRVWFQMIASMRPASAMFICWAVYASIMATTYMIISLRLIKTIRNELQKYDDAPMYGVIGIFRNGQLSSDDDNYDKEQQRGTTAADQGSGTRVHPSPMTAKSRSNSGSTTIEAGKLSSKVSSGTLAQSPLSTSASNGNDDDDDGYTGWRRFVPNIVMHKNASLSRINALDSRAKQMRELRKAWLYICIQLLSVTPACMVMAVLKTLLAATTYGFAEQPSESGGTRFEYFLNVEILLIVWCVVPAGSITLLAIAFRAYEPVFASISSSMQAGSGRSGLDQAKSTFFETNTTFFETHTVVVGQPSNKDDDAHRQQRGGSRAL